MGLLGYVVGLQEDVRYVAQGTLFLADPNLGDELQGIVSARISAEEYVPRQAARIQSRAVLQEAADLIADQAA